MTTAMTRATIAIVRVSMARPYSVSLPFRQTLLSEIAPGRRVQDEEAAGS